ncbi:MAG: hypothetical protein HZA48_01810 [Planctomycetes bacterium]|nr:hypothetical protein [Planctomycetota bacterium]
MTKKGTKIKEKLVNGLGKMRRIYKVYAIPWHVRKKLKGRIGECKRCGACCRLMFDCPALFFENGLACCKIYDKRSKVCRKFPIEPRDLKDRDLINPYTPCGYDFTK